ARAATLVAVAAGTAAAATGLASRPALLVAGPTSFVDSPLSGIEARNSPAAVTHPSDPAVVVVAHRVDTPQISCGLSRSTDGGSAWQALELPLAAAATNCYSPDVAFTPDGTLLVAYATTAGRFNLPAGLWLQAFRGPAPDGRPVAVAGDGAFYPRLATTGTQVVVTWVQAGPADTRGAGLGPGPNPVMAARSTDGGRTFAPPVRVSDPSRRPIQPAVVAGDGGRVAIVAYDLADDRLNYESLHLGQGGPAPPGRWRVVAWASTDGGASFGPAVVVASFEIAERIYVDLAPAPSVARDPQTGRLFSAWDGGRGDERTVFVARSDDGGTTWRAPVAVAPGPGAQYLPALAVGSGRVDVAFYDRRRDPLDRDVEVTFASSWDGGQTFATATASDRPFNSRVGFGSLQGIPVLGTRLGLVAGSGHALAFWADTRRGTLDTNRQDVAVARVTVDAARERQWPRFAAGLATAAAGVVGLVASRRPRRTGR
ncbi:MAG: sialidase family protein, partial [Acidimicrobiales bacterium]